MTLDTFISKYMGKKLDYCFLVPRSHSLLKRSRVWLDQSLTTSVPWFRSFFETGADSKIWMSRINMFSKGRKELEVFNSVISNFLINMVNNFSLFKTSSKYFFHNESVFSKISLFITPLSIRHINKPISFSFNLIKSSSWFSNLALRVTSVRTIGVFMMGYFANKTNFAIFTGKHIVYYLSLVEQGQVAI